MKKLLIALSGVFLGFVGCACAVSWSAKDFSDKKTRKKKFPCLSSAQMAAWQKSLRKDFLQGVTRI